MPSCCCPSEDRRGRSRCGRSWRTSPGAATCPGTPRRGGAALPALRRGVADQPDQPGSDRRTAGRAWTFRSTSATATGNRTSKTRRGHARQRHSACSGVHHLGMEWLLGLHPVFRGSSTGPARGRSRCARTGQTAAATSTTRSSSRCSLTTSAPLRTPCPKARGWCSPRTRSRWPPTTAWGRQLYSRQVALCRKACRGSRRVRGLRRGLAVAVGATTGAVAGTGRARPRRRPHRGGTTAVIVCPIGFVADHIEVVWDLDTELREQADAAGVALARVSTPNADPRFARLAVDLIDELRAGRAPARVSGPDPVPGCAAGINGQPCRPPHCAAEIWPGQG